MELLNGEHFGVLGLDPLDETVSFLVVNGLQCCLGCRAVYQCSIGRAGRFVALPSVFTQFLEVPNDDFV